MHHPPAFLPTFVVAAAGQPSRFLGLSDRELDDFVVRPVRIVLVIVIALALQILARRTINRLVRGTREGRVGRRLDRASLLIDTSPAAIERRRQRALTLGSVLRSITSFVIFAVAVVTILGEIGIDLAPILASAGIVGVAVGFGAQNLVKDFLSGLFLILEDTYGVGDVVNLGPATGTVEAVGLRSTRIRDVQGTLWTLQNGNIPQVANYSQLWQRALFDTLLPRGADLERARALMLAAAQDVADRPTFEGVVLEAPSVWGVHDVSPQGVVLRLAVRRRTGHDDYDRVVREQIVERLEGAGIRLFLLPADPS